MSVISSRKQIANVLDRLETLYYSLNNTFWQEFEEEILNRKVKFPILEHIAERFYKSIESGDQISFLNAVIERNKIPSYVIAGKMLQLRLSLHWNECFDKAIEYMIKGGEWYTCDIISERVLGMALLNDFDASLTKLQPYLIHENKWIRRAPGTATHLAVKWGLEKDKIPLLFNLLTKQFNTKDHHVKKGCGWGVETMAKLHPELITKHEALLLSKNTNAWIRYKYKLGLKKGEKIRQKLAIKNH